MSTTCISNTTSTTRIRTRILVLSDTHAVLPDLINRPDLQAAERLPEADVVIHCGDLTSCGKYYEHQRALTLLKGLPAPLKIVIPGNHDMTLDPAYMQKNSRLHGWTKPHLPSDLHAALALYADRDAREAGIRYIVEGLYSFILPNGAKLTVYASAYTPAFCNWAFAHPRSVDRFNVGERHVPDNPVPSFSPYDINGQPSNDQVTVMVTHGPPRGILDKTTHGESVGCDHLMTAVSRCRPLLHCFGHIHEAHGTVTRLWPGDAENGGAIGSEAAELRRPNETTGISRNGNSSGHDTVHALSHSGADENGDPTEVRDEIQGSGSTLEEPRFLISHQATSSNSNGTNFNEDHQPVLFVDATGAEHGRQTVFVNASIMDVRYRPSQLPWLVQLDLPMASKNEIEGS